MKKIVLTGGPGGGKTTALDLFRREFKDGIHIIPEAATILFKNGLPRGSNEIELKKTQISIYNLQICLESIYTQRNPGFCHLCDRGTLDSLAYWPDSEESFFEASKSSFEKEMSRYDAVLFFETGASGGANIMSNNPTRTESSKEAVELDKKLQRIWSHHPNYHFISSKTSFVDKVIEGLNKIKEVLGE